MSTTSKGREAESRVASYLESKGHKILAKNWQNRWCEIDVVTTCKKTVFFTEVKYRSNDNWGDGFEYITKSKLKQMKFAAEFWLNENNWKNESQLQVAAVDSEFNINLIEI